MVIETGVSPEMGEEGQVQSEANLPSFVNHYDLFNRWHKSEAEGGLSECQKRVLLGLDTKDAIPFINITAAEGIYRSLQNNEVDLTNCTISESTTPSLSPAAPQSPSGRGTTGEPTALAPETPRVDPTADKGTALNPFTFGEFISYCYGNPNAEINGTHYINAESNPAVASATIARDALPYLIQQGLNIMPDRDPFASKINIISPETSSFGNIDNGFTTYDLLRLLYTVAEHPLPTEVAKTLAAAGSHESGGPVGTPSRPGIVNSGTDCIGLFQINWPVHEMSLSDLGISRSDLFTPKDNARAALGVASNFATSNINYTLAPWESYNNGHHQQHIVNADNALGELVRQIAAADAALQTSSN